MRREIEILWNTTVCLILWKHTMMLDEQSKASLTLTIDKLIRARRYEFQKYLWNFVWQKSFFHSIFFFAAAHIPSYITINSRVCVDVGQGGWTLLADLMRGWERSGPDDFERRVDDTQKTLAKQQQKKIVGINFYAVSLSARRARRSMSLFQLFQDMNI